MATLTGLIRLRLSLRVDRWSICLAFGSARTAFEFACGDHSPWRATLTGFESLEPTTSAPSLVDWKCVICSDLQITHIFANVKRSCEFLRYFAVCSSDLSEDLWGLRAPHRQGSLRRSRSISSGTGGAGFRNPRKSGTSGTASTRPFIQGRTADGGTVRILSIIDEYSRECLLLKPARNFPVLPSATGMAGRRCGRLAAMRLYCCSFALMTSFFALIALILSPYSLAPEVFCDCKA